ncbi:MAG: formylmethanofuran dehydrogenase subunit C [Candidatus Bathyarchaeota archaeon]|nr:formylmethanofuran dehydrogenase subunit C [Candidatus Bathyarchaeota archaeon]
MGEVILKPKFTFNVPIEMFNISPDVFSGRTIKEIRELKVYEGNRKKKLSDLFDVEGESSGKPEDVVITIKGDVSKARRIGSHMTTGKIIVEGNAGHMLGYEMRGGLITVYGNAGLWVGCKMKDGVIEVFGNVEDNVGGSLRGEKPGKGMSGGSIIVHGNAGAEVGRGMKSGLIIINGDVGPLVGVDMVGGNIGVKGNCEGKAGARMRGGRVVICGSIPEILPSFYIEEVRESIKIKAEKFTGPFYVFVGDCLADIKCNGRLLVSVNNNHHLKPYEKFLE